MVLVELLLELEKHIGNNTFKPRNPVNVQETIQVLLILVLKMIPKLRIDLEVEKQVLKGEGGSCFRVEVKRDDD